MGTGQPTEKEGAERMDDLDMCIIPASMGLSRDNSASSTTEIRDHEGVCPERSRKMCHHGEHAVIF